MAENDVQKRQPKNFIQSAVRALTLLATFRADQPSLTPPQIAERTGQDRGTTFRLIKTLVALGFLQASADNRRFSLTLKNLEIGYNALHGVELRSELAPILRELVPEFGDAASYGVLDGDDVVYVIRYGKGMSHSGFDRRPGSRTKAYAAALGHVVLAYLPREEQVRRLHASVRPRLSDRTLVEIDDLLQRLETVRAVGYALSDRENAFGLRTIATPILFPDGTPLGGISVTIAAERMKMDEFVETTLPVARDIAQKYSDRLAHIYG